MENQDRLFDRRELRIAALVLRAIDHELRMQICERMALTGGYVTVQNIGTDLDIKEYIVEQHMAILNRAGVTESRQAGWHTIYGLNHQRIGLLRKAITMMQ